MSSVLMSLCTADVTPDGAVSATIRTVSVAPEHARLLESLCVGSTALNALGHALSGDNDEVYRK